MSYLKIKHLCICKCWTILARSFRTWNGSVTRCYRSISICKDSQNPTILTWQYKACILQLSTTTVAIDRYCIRTWTWLTAQRSLDFICKNKNKLPRSTQNLEGSNRHCPLWRSGVLLPFLLVLVLRHYPEHRFHILSSRWEVQLLSVSWRLLCMHSTVVKQG